MCGVGKFMVRWKEKETACCPRCGEYEDARHVWLCNNVDACNLWKTELDKLMAWLVTIDTDPEIIDALIDNLRQRFLAQEVQPKVYTNKIRMGIQKQENIGWVNFFEGFIIQDWQDLQQHYYSSIRSLRTGRRWHQAVLKRLWDIAWKLWEQRNSAMHEAKNRDTGESDRINKKIEDLYMKLQDRTTAADNYLFTMSLQRLKSKGLIYKKEWIAQANNALDSLSDRLSQEDISGIRHQQHREALIDRRRRRQRMMRQMQASMHAWISRSG
jgi:hypothetical protein